MMHSEGRIEGGIKAIIEDHHLDRHNINGKPAADYLESLLKLTVAEALVREKGSRHSIQHIRHPLVHAIWDDDVLCKLWILTLGTATKIKLNNYISNRKSRLRMSEASEPDVGGSPIEFWTSGSEQVASGTDGSMASDLRVPSNTLRTKNLQCPDSVHSHDRDFQQSQIKSSTGSITSINGPNPRSRNKTFADLSIYVSSFCGQQEAPRLSLQQLGDHTSSESPMFLEALKQWLVAEDRINFDPLNDIIVQPQVLIDDHAQSWYQIKVEQDLDSALQEQFANPYAKRFELLTCKSPDLASIKAGLRLPDKEVIRNIERSQNVHFWVLDP